MSHTSSSERSERMLKLMAYADGELEGSERAEVEKLIASDADAKRFVAELGTLGSYVRLGHEEPKAAASFDIADAVMKAAETTRPEPKVVSLAAAREARRPNARGAKVGAGIAAALALAASVFFFMRHPAEAPVAVAPSLPSVNAPGQGALGAQGAQGTGVDVDAVESAGHSVSVFYLPAGNELTTSVVVWVDETGEK